MLKLSLLLIAVCVLIARLEAASAAPRLLGSVRGAGSQEKSYLYLGGGFFPGKGWRTDEQSKAALHAGTRWQLFGLDGPKANVTTGSLLPPDVPAGISALLRQPLPGTGELIAVSNVGPDAQPRLPRAQSLHQPLYQKAAAAVLRAGGFKIQSARLNQLLRVDLNGDGIEEVLMGASSRADFGHTPETRAGDYLLLALRFVDAGQVKNVPLDLGFSTKNVGFSAPGYASVMACVDVDGDGRMEIVVANGYYEGWGFDVWRFDGHTIQRVVQAGWGV